jgi:hypothetical protein
MKSVNAGGGGRKGARNETWIDVHIWKPGLPDSVGHAMACMHKNPHWIYCNAWPAGEVDTPSLAVEQLCTNYQFLLKNYGRPADGVFTVAVPDIQKFYTVAANHRARRYWAAFPQFNKDMTNCSYAVACALKAGGVDVYKNVVAPLTLRTQILQLTMDKNRLYHNPAKKFQMIIL